MKKPSFLAPTYATIQIARAEYMDTTGKDLAAGTLLTAPLAPASGPIAGAPESLVVVTVKKFWQSPTIVALRNAVFAAVGLALLGVAGQVMTSNGDLSQINWQTTQKIAIGTVCFSLASAYASWWKTRDNNAVK